MKAKASRWQRTAEIESRQDELLRQLDELNARIERALAELGVALPGGLSPRDETPCDRPLERAA
jgi:hypothetical protein